MVKYREGGELMRKRPIAILSAVAALALTAPAYAETISETRETTTITKSGTVSEVSPSSSTIIVRSEGAQPSRYIYNSQTAWVDPEGNKISVETVRDQPVTVYYEKNGDEMVVTRVVTRKPASKIIEERKTTTTTTESDE
jgi:hypothetical protein